MSYVLTKVFWVCWGWLVFCCCVFWGFWCCSEEILTTSRLVSASLTHPEVLGVVDDTSIPCSSTSVIRIGPWWRLDSSEMVEYTFLASKCTWKKRQTPLSLGFLHKNESELFSLFQNMTKWWCEYHPILIFLSVLSLLDFYAKACRTVSLVFPNHL